MESVQIKQEIKEEPLDPDDFNPALIPKGKEKQLTIIIEFLGPNHVLC